MKCQHCNGRKGKRNCPALAGPICSACCGEERMLAITCPIDCQYLGGLAAFADPDRAIAALTKTGLNAAQALLTEFAFRPAQRFLGNAAAEVFRGTYGRELPEWAAPALVGYITLGHRDPAGQRMLDHLIAERKRRLDFQTAAGLLAMARSWATLLEIERIDLDRGLAVRDLFSGEKLYLSEKLGTHTLARWDVTLGWVGPEGAHLTLHLGVCSIPRMHVEKVLTTLREALEAAGRSAGSPPRRDISDLLPLCYHTLREAMESQALPQLANTSGDAMVLCRARFDVEDEATVRALLAACAELHESDGGYSWRGRSDSPILAGNVTLGRIRLHGARLELETNSRERLERGKALLAGLLGSRIRHRLDSSADPWVAAMNRPEPGEDRPGSEAGRRIPPELERELLGEYYRRHYATWLDVPLPALDGKTPRDAAHTAEGLAKVDALLKDIESGTVRLPGGDTVDFGALRREVGLAP